MRICIVYDCLFPHTVGGAERWYRNLAERLALEGHTVTYLTLRQWERGSDPGLADVDVRAVGPRMALYVGGRRRILPPVVFGAGVLLHLLRHGRRYDVVHAASFPYFSLLAAAVARPLGRYRLVVDWFEVWTRAYWEEYLGRAGGRIGWLVQRLCARVPQTAFCFSRRHAERLRKEGLRGEVTQLPGMYAGPLEARPRRRRARAARGIRRSPHSREAGARPGTRHGGGGRAGARAALRRVRRRARAGGGERLVEALELGATVRVLGFVEAEQIERALDRALCMVLPSRREGYGMVVVEAAARGTPSVVVDEPDNAAVELVEDGVNGVLAASVEPADLAAAILGVRAAGAALRDSTAEWFARNARRLSLDASLDVVTASYGAGRIARS